MKGLSFLFFLITILASCLNKKVEKHPQTGKILLEKAYEFWGRGEMDSTFSNFNRAKDIFISHNDSLNASSSLLCMGIIATDKGDYLSGQELSFDALAYLKESKKAHYDILHRNYNNLAIASYKLKDYQNAFRFYEKAIGFASEPNDKVLYLNNKAKAYEDYGNYKEAIRIYSSILGDTSVTRAQYAMILANVSFAKWSSDATYNPVPELLKSLSIRRQEDDLKGQNFVYARLADYYSKNNLTQAKYYANQMYEAAKKIDVADDKLEALEKLVKLSSGEKSKYYFESYRNLEDSVQTAKNASKNQFAIIRYETEKHKADNLVLQKDNTEKKYQLIKERSLLIAGLTIALFVIVLSIILYKKRKQRIELASQNAIRENQLKTSKKVHDVVANGLYRVMTEIENNEDLNKGEVLDKLEDMYEKSRDLSYEELHYTDKNFHEKIGTLLKSFAGEHVKVVIVGNTSDVWNKVNAQDKYEVEHILQELMVNMKKHSCASNVAVRFVNKESKIEIYYTDNGVGMLPEQQFNNGLTNTGNRIIAIDGEITFDTKAEKGLKIQISFPIS